MKRSLFIFFSFVFGWAYSVEVEMNSVIDTFPEQQQGFFFVVDSGKFVFSSSNESVLKVDQSGEFFAKDSGYAVVSALSGNIILKKLIYVRTNCNRFSFVDDSVCHGALLEVQSDDTLLWYSGSLLQDSGFVYRTVETGTLGAGYNKLYAKKIGSECFDPKMPFSFYLIPRPDVSVPAYNYYCSGEVVADEGTMLFFSDSRGDSLLYTGNTVPDWEAGYYAPYVGIDDGCRSELHPFEFYIKDCGPYDFSVSGNVHGSSLPAYIYLLDSQFSIQDSVISYDGSFVLHLFSEGKYTYWVKSDTRSFYYGGSSDPRRAYFAPIASGMSGFDVANTRREVDGCGWFFYENVWLPATAKEKPAVMVSLSGSVLGRCDLSSSPAVSYRSFAMPYFLRYYNGCNYQSVLIWGK